MGVISFDLKGRIRWCSRNIGIERLVRWSTCIVLAPLVVELENLEASTTTKVAFETTTSLTEKRLIADISVDSKDIPQPALKHWLKRTLASPKSNNDDDQDGIEDDDVGVLDLEEEVTDPSDSLLQRQHSHESTKDVQHQWFPLMKTTSNEFCVKELNRLF